MSDASNNIKNIEEPSENSNIDGAISTILKYVVLNAKNMGKTHISVAELVLFLQERGFGLLLILFVAPISLPLPAIGIAQIMALPLLFFSAQMIIGRKSPWLPEKLATKQISLDSLDKISDKIEKYLRKIESIIKPRLSFITSHQAEKFIGLCCLLCSISIAMPFPFSNTIPGMGMLLMAIGLIERDGLLVIAGMIIGAIGIAIATVIMYYAINFGMDAAYFAVENGKDYVKELFGFTSDANHSTDAIPLTVEEL